MPHMLVANPTKEILNGRYCEADKSNRKAPQDRGQKRESDSNGKAGDAASRNDRRARAPFLGAARLPGWTSGAGLAARGAGTAQNGVLADDFASTIVRGL